MTQRVAPDHSYHSHCLLRSFPQRVALARQGHSWPNPPAALSLQLLSLMRAIAPQTPFPLDLGAPISPFLLYCLSPQISYDCPLDQDLSKRIVRIYLSGFPRRRFLARFPHMSFRPLSRPCMKYSFPNNVWSAAYHTESNPWIPKI